jgi:hypothetical protein
LGQRDDDKLVRQLSLVAFLMAQQRPVTAEEIHEAVEGYGGMSEQAFLRRFYSDRSELEGVGLKLAVERPSDDPFQGDLYAMPPENYYLPPIEFDEAELSALHTSLYLLEGQFAYAEPLRLALQHLTLGRPSPLDDHAARTVAVNLLGSRHTAEVSSHLIKIESAISRRKTIRFRYYSIGRDDLGNDPRLAQNDGRSQHAELIDGAIAEWTTQRGRDEVIEALKSARVPAGYPYTAADIVSDPHYLARQMIEQVQTSVGPLKVPGVLPKLSRTPGRIGTGGPQLGEHNDDILAGLGLSAEQVAGLRERGII